MGMKTGSNSWEMRVAASRIDWPSLKARLDIVAVATNLLGPAQGKRGPTFTWKCPFHEDSTPSFEADRTRKTWVCWTCGIHGDASELVQRVKAVDFVGSIRYLDETFGTGPSQSVPQSPVVPAPPPKPPKDEPTGLPLDEASSLVADSAGCLWGPLGRPALDYLHGRGLTDETILRGEAGFHPRSDGPDEGRRPDVPRGGDRHPLDRRRPTHQGQDPPGRRDQTEIRRSLLRPTTHLSGPRRDPSWATHDHLRGRARRRPTGPATTGVQRHHPGFGIGPDRFLRHLADAAAPKWFAALDADRAGDSASTKFPARAIRVRPPDKDWTDTHAGGCNRIRYCWSGMIPLSTFPEGVEFTDPATLTETASLTDPATRPTSGKANSTHAS